MPIRMWREGRTRQAVAFKQPSAIARPDEACGSETLAEALISAIEASDYRPPVLPPIAIELVALATRVDVTLEEVVPLVERDGWFAAHLRAVATAEATATGVKLGSMRQVCLYYGMLQIRDLAIEAALGECVFRSQRHADAMESLRRHAVATGHLARALAESTTVAGEFAYVAGLLHDVGLAGALRLLEERERDFGPMPDGSVLWPALAQIHGRIGAAMTRHWGFPDEVRSAVESHHALTIGEDASPLAAALAVASDLAHQEGFGLDAVATTNSPNEADALRDGAEAKSDGEAADRLPPHVLDRQLALLGLSRPQLHLIAHRAKGALRD